MPYHLFVFGERNSGTTFLYDLLRTNFDQVITQSYVSKRVVNWKHTAPDSIEDKKDFVPVIIVRKLNSWLISMFNNPHHLQQKEFRGSFQTFLTCKQKSTNGIQDTKGRPCNYQDIGKNILDIRNEKMQLFLDFYNACENGVIINLEYLQESEENRKLFLATLAEHFEKQKPVTFDLPHSKQKEIKSMNRTYSQTITSADQQLIDKYKNNAYEQLIDGIFVVKKKGVQVFGTKTLKS